MPSGNGRHSPFSGGERYERADWMQSKSKGLDEWIVKHSDVVGQPIKPTFKPVADSARTSQEADHAHNEARPAHRCPAQPPTHPLVPRSAGRPVSLLAQLLLNFVAPRLADFWQRASKALARRPHLARPAPQ